MEDSVHLAPHGVPSNPIPRVLSSSKLQDMPNESQNYGAVNNSTNLHPYSTGKKIPTNPKILT